MKAFLPFFSSTEAPPALVTEVISVLSGNEISALVHLERRPEEGYGSLHFALTDQGVFCEAFTHRGSHQERFRASDPAEMSGEILRRIYRFARDFGIGPSGVSFWVDRQDHRKERAEGLRLPTSWSAATLKLVQENYDFAIRRDKGLQSLKLCRQGEEQLSAGHVRRAVRLFRAARELAPDFFFPWRGLGECAVKERKWDEAEDYLRRAARFLEKNGTFLKKKIRETEQKRIIRAQDELRRLRAAFPPAGAEARTVPAAESPPVASLPVPAIEISFQDEPAPPALVENYRSQIFEPLALYHLRSEAEKWKLLGGFGELLAPGRSHLAPFEHQTRTAQIVLRRMRGRALLADEVGLGKTIEAGLILKEYLLRGMVSKVLILAVPSLVSQWQEELFEKFDIPAETLDPTWPPSHFWSRAGVTIASLSLARRDPHRQIILEQNYDLVIVDEAHHLRNRQTLAWTFVNQIKKRFLLLLTATPIQNRLEDLYSLATLLRPGQLGTPGQFHKEFQQRANSRRPKNTEALRSLLREIMIRHTRASVALRLPRRIARRVPVEFTESERRAYDAVSSLVRTLPGNRFLLTLLQREAGSSWAAVRPTLEKLRPQWPSEAAPGLDALLRDPALQTPEGSSKRRALEQILSRTPDPCLVFTEFRATQAFLAEALRQSGRAVGLFHGALSASERAEAIRRFEEKGGVLLSTPVGGEGANMQFCRTLINYDLPWNPMKIEQRIGRLHRIGQTGEVLIYNLAASGTVEDYLLKILDEKLNLFELVVGEAETILGDLTEEMDFEQRLMDIWIKASSPGDLDKQMDDFGRRIAQEKEKYLEIKNYDESLLGADYEAV